jgi:succinoglycan biosynthesis protein ExoO
MDERTMPPDVSVIIAAYNVENYIERAVRSALEQQDVTVEVIVVNDASTDGTAAAIARIDDAHIKRIDLAVNGGPGAARNAGIAAATAPWIAILDGDDMFLPGRLARCLIRARAVKADIVVDNLAAYREADGAEYPMFNPVRFARLGVLDLAHFIDGNRFFLGNGEALGYVKPIFAASFLKQRNLRYDHDLRIGEDYLLLCEALANGARCIVEPQAGYRYTVRKGSISHRLTPADVERIADGDRTFLARHSLGPAAAQAQKRREYGLKEALAYTRLLDALKQRSVREAFRAVRQCPPAARHLWQPVRVRVRRLFRGGKKAA